MEQLNDRMYFDELGNEIHEGDLLRVFHFVGVRKRIYFMYKVARLKDGHWYGCDYNNDHTYLLKIVADKETGIIKGTRIINRAKWDEDFKQSI